MLPKLLCFIQSHVTITSDIFLGLKAFFNQKEFPFTDLTFTTNNIYAILNQKRDLELEVDSMQCFMCNKNQKTMIKFMATQHIQKKTPPKIDGLVVHLSFSGKGWREDTGSLNGHYRER